jgi:hypothetical protein
MGKLKRSIVYRKAFNMEYKYQGMPAVICGTVRSADGVCRFDVRVAELGCVAVVHAGPDELEPSEWDEGDNALLDTLPPDMAAAMRAGDFRLLSREALGLEEVMPAFGDAAELVALMAELRKIVDGKKS